ncbi:MAG: class I adenylate-forming enzyme family protein [Chloroflexota bacterium]
MSLVHHFLEDSARWSPDKTALVCGDRRLSFREIDEASNRVANGLVAEGVARADRVAVYMENSIEVVVAIFGILKAGAIFSVIDSSTKADKLAYMVRDERPVALMTANDTLRRRVMYEMLPLAPVPLVIWTGDLPEGEAPDAVRFRDWESLVATESMEAPRVATIDLDLATIIYTSGSTGNPKGVMSTHRNMVFAATSISTYLENTSDDIIFCALPLAFDYGLYQLIMAMRVGATLVLEKNFVFPHRALEIVIRERVTGFPGVPTMFSTLLDLKDLQSYDLKSLRYISNTAAALPVSHIVGLRAAFPRVTLFSMYGLTECKRVSYLPPEELDRRSGSVGIAIPGTEVYIIDHEGNRVGPGVVGELIVRGSHVMRGYWEKPDETAKRYKPGSIPGEVVLHTGDLFRTDDEGFLYFVGRQDDIIKSRGEKVSPKEIENALYGMEGVLEVAVIGIPDEKLGEAIQIFVAPKAGAPITERDIRAYCARHLEDFMAPKYVEIWPSLPKGGSGKIEKKELRACVESRVG